MTLPRYHSKARITLASVPLDANQRNPLLTPYPNWAMNTGDSCDVLQDVSAIKIDKDGIMWVVDGKRALSQTDCPAKLVLLDLNNNGRVVDTYKIPKRVCSKDEGCIINDIVLNGDFAYMAFYSKSDLGIL